MDRTPQRLRNPIAAALLLPLLAALLPHAAAAKGATLRIEIRGDGLAEAIEISDPAILGEFHIWNGPGVSINGRPYHLDPNRRHGQFIDWIRGRADDRPSGLRRLEVVFHVGRPDRDDGVRYYRVAWELAPGGDGYIFLPRWTNDLISHGVEGHWFHASHRWQELIAPIVAARSLPGAGQSGSLDCSLYTGRIAEDGTIEFYRIDASGKRRLNWRFPPSSESHASVLAHLGDLPQGEEFAVSCWPPRR